MSSPRAVVPVVYVADPARSQAYYELLGFTTAASGQDEDWRWVLVQSGELSMVLAAGHSAPLGDSGPAVLYLQVSDLEAVQGALTQAGHPVERLGFPDHAPGGEARAVDPDGHGIMLGQPAAVVVGDGHRPIAVREGGVLTAAAEAVRRRRGAGQRCQIGRTGNEPCDAPAEVKLADSWGDTAWSCLEHTDEVLVNARGAFIATEDSQGLEQFLRLRRLSRSS